MAEQKDSNDLDSESLEIQKIQEQLYAKDQLIEALQGKLRLQELEFKKKEISLSNELGQEQQHVEQLQELLKETSQIEKLKQISLSMEEKLAETEEKLLDLQSIDRQTKKDLYNIEKENMELKQAVQQLQKKLTESISQENNNNNSSSNQTPKTQCFTNKMSTDNNNQQQQQIEAIEEDEYEDIDKGELVTLLMSTTREKEELEAQASKIKQGAIDAIMEKERLIIDLQEQLEQMAIQVTNQGTVESNNDEFLNQIDKYQNDYERLDIEFQHYKQEAEQEISQFQEQIKHLYDKIDQDAIQQEEIMYQLERENKERNFEYMKDQESNSKLVETQLLQQVEENQQKYRNLDKQHQELQRTFDHLKEEKYAEQQKNERFKEDNHKKLGQIEELQIQNRKISQSIEQIEKKLNKKLSEKTQLLEKQTHKLEDQVRKVLELETDLKQYQETNQQIKTEKKDLIEKFDQMQEDFEERIQKMKQMRERELSQKMEMNSSSNIEGKEQQAGKKNSLEGIEFNLQSELQSQLDNNTDSTSTSNIQNNITDFNNNNSNVTPLKTNGLLVGTSTGRSSASNKKYDFENLRSPRTNVKLQFHEYQRDIKSLKDERRVLEDKNDELDLENQSLTQENTNLKSMIGKLENSNAILQEEIDNLQKELKDYYKARQESRKNQIHYQANNKIDLDQQTRLISELDETRQHLKKIETHLLTYKLQHVEDKNYLEEELQLQHSKNQELQAKLKEITSDKQYLSLKYRDKKSRRNNNLSMDLDAASKSKGGWSLFNKNNNNY